MILTVAQDKIARLLLKRGWRTVEVDCRIRRYSDGKQRSVVLYTVDPDYGFSFTWAITVPPKTEYRTSMVFGTLGPIGITFAEFVISFYEALPA
jgi:hypothetical protein